MGEKSCVHTFTNGELPAIMDKRGRIHKRLIRTGIAFILVAALAGALVSWPATDIAAAGTSADSQGTPGSLDLGILNLVWRYIQSAYYYPIDAAKLAEGAVKGMVQALGDPYSEYMSAQEYQDTMGSLGGTFGGLGIYIEVRGDYVEVVSPIKGTPAWRAGLLPGDKIAEVNGVDFRGKTANQASSVLRGAPGTTVTVGILRPGVSRMLHFTLTREIIVVNPVEYTMKENKFGLITLSTFNEHTAEKMEEALAALKAQGAKALVLDLRDDPGGFLDQAIAVAEMFLKKGDVILQIESKSQGTEIVRVEKGVSEPPLPLVVLINKGSASASEIVTAALKDNRAATVIGETSYGKGSVQNIYGFTTGSGLKITVANYLSPNGSVINKIGITPDIVVKGAGVAGGGEADTLTGTVEAGAPLRPWDAGLRVQQLQRALRYLGFDPAADDGVYGYSTLAAVTAFERSKKLPFAPILGEDFVTAVNQMVLGEALHPSADPQLDRALKYLNDAYLSAPAGLGGNR